MLQEIRRRPLGNESEIMEKERSRRQDLYHHQLNDRRQSHESLLQVQEQLLKIFAKLKVSARSVCVSDWVSFAKKNTSRRVCSAGLKLLGKTLLS